MSSKYLVWDASPNAFKTGVLHLPFPVSIWGLVLAAVLFFIGYSYLEKKEREKFEGTDKEDKEVVVNGYLLLGLGIVSLIIGQLLFLFVIHGPMIHHIGPITVRWYGMMWALAFIVGYFLGTKMYRDAGKPQEELESLLTYIIIATVIGARLGHVLFYEPTYYFNHPSEIIKIWHGGLASHGAAIGMIIAIWLYCRKFGYKFLWVTDRVMVPVAIGGSFVRIGNFFNSEIIGHVTHVPWAIIFERRDMLPRHPSQLYESIWYFSLFVILWFIYKKYKNKPPEGFLFGFAMIYMFIGRFMIEFTKVRQADFGHGWPLDMGQILSIPFILLGIWILWKKVDFNKVKHPPDSTESPQAT
ncbi:MAG TPA: prolipoprotein diacylglyceryl transferase [Balneolaceae bacterium]|nr:prolipoprotein diacylglyceryl transferase [Balneolales bacterium]HKK46068.1 prolipoprotein diacylglyceryl transferase [Balneolaceae bacterium]